MNVSNGVKNKAFIFDMDGVLVDSEHAWEPFELPMLKRILGEDIAANIGDLTGNSIRGVYEKARELGSSVTETEIANAYDEAAQHVYSVAAVAEGLDSLGQKLVESGFKLALVTHSPLNWVERVLPRIPFANQFQVVLSIRERNLRPKPAPDGYLEVLRMLQVKPIHSMALEDANAGIQSAKAAGIYVIGFRGLLPDGYKQEGADAYADTMEEVQKLVEEFTRR